MLRSFTFLIKDQTKPPLVTSCKEDKQMRRYLYTMVETRNSKQKNVASPIYNSKAKPAFINKSSEAIMNSSIQPQPAVPTPQQAPPISNTNANNATQALPVPSLPPQAANLPNHQAADEYIRRIFQYAQAMPPLTNSDQANVRYQQQNENVCSRDVINGNSHSHFRMLQSHKRKALDSLAPLVDNLLLRIVEKLFKNRNLSDGEIDRITFEKFDEDYYHSSPLSSRKKRSRFSYGTR